MQKLTLYNLPSIIIKIGIGVVLFLAVFAVISMVSPTASADCKNNRDCKNNDRPICDPGGRGTCVQCTGNQHCKTNERCRQQKCEKIPPPPPPPPPPSADSTHVCPITTADIMLVIDNSNSMQGAKLASAKSAAMQFVDIVAKNSQMRIGLATFDNNGNLNQIPTSNYAQIKNVINSQTTGGKGGTCLECAIDGKGSGDVMGAFAQAGNVGNTRHVIILTDGLINRWINQNGEIVGGTTNAERQKAMDQAEGAIARVSNTHGAVFWTVQYGTTAYASWLQSLVAKYIGNKGAYYNDQSASLEQIYRAIANEIMGGSITAFTFYDQNNNSTFDAGEKPLANVLTKLNTASKNTDVNGKAVFDKLCPTNYTLSVTAPEDYKETPASSLTKQVSLTPGGNITENFAFIKDGPVIQPAKFLFSLALHGIGIAGDNVIPRPPVCARTTSATPSGCLSNQNPLHPERELTVDILDTLGKAIATVSGKLLYSSTSGTFESTVAPETILTAGPFTFRIHTPMYLKKKILYSGEVEAGETYELPLTNLTSSDVDNDNVLTILDYNMIATCYSLPNQPNPCTQEEVAEVDNDDNGIIDEYNINLFTREISVQQGD